MLVALHVANHERLDLSVVETEPRESGYPGTLESFTLGATDNEGQPSGGNAFPPRDRLGQRDGANPGPIRFAIRVLPRTGAPETERRQVVVYVIDRAILVAEKLVTASRWTPRLRIDALGVTDVVAIQPGWH